MRRQRSTRILATLGPATSDRDTIARLFEAGADVFRLNFSHGDHADHRARYDTIRAIEKETGRPIGILMDLQGPKLRVGTFGDGKVTLEAGAKFRLDLESAPGDGGRVCLPHPEIFQAIRPETMLLLDDGKVRLRVLGCDAGHAETEVVTAGVLSDNKGVNVPGVVLPISVITEKDREDLEFGLELGVDWVGMSFVQRPEDLEEGRALIAGRAALMAKLEKPAAIDCLDEIIAGSDALMVARGDLGVELPPEDVPRIQRQIVRDCRAAGKPVVVATQMLESMIQAPTPTRAEASDVATAVYEGADAVMLSAETAAGDYPIEAVTMMDRIIRGVERDPSYLRVMDAEHPDPQATASDAITAAARQVAHTISAVVIVTYTSSGSTALRASRERPEVPILSLTPSLATARRLALAWGVHCIITDDIGNTTVMVDQARHHARAEGFGEAEAPFVITAGVPFGTPGATNLLRIAWV
ncbi:MAG: pyruvate kinase [Alphaproteobacteria bacterium]|nr:pyruvate kinase [Alphaproteobacteria bacterium]